MHACGSVLLSAEGTAHEQVHPQVEIVRMWERDARTLAVRWKLRCFPHLLSDKLVSLDGVSEYCFDERGLIYRHMVRTYSAA